MKWWQVSCIGLISLAVAGCRVPRSAVSALEQENRQLEDRLYQLSDLLRQCRRENQRLRRELGLGRETTDQFMELEPGPLPDLTDTPVQQLPKGETGTVSPPVVEGVPPVTSLPAEERLELPLAPPGPDLRPVPDTKHSPGEMPPASDGGETDRSGLQAPSSEQQRPPTSQASPADRQPAADVAPGASSARESTGAELPRPQAASVQLVDNKQVAAITLNDLVLGGYDEDGRPGDDGIVLLVEPRNAAGRIVPAAAPISVVVLDPALSGQKARLARWDLAAEAVAAAYRRMPMAEGIYLQLPWPGAMPVHSRLHLFVRYTTDDRRHVETDREITVEPVGSSRPTQSQSGRIGPAGDVSLASANTSTRQVVTASSRSGPAAGSPVPTLQRHTNARGQSSGRGTVSRGEATDGCPPGAVQVSSSSSDVRSERSGSVGRPWAVRPRPVWSPYR